MYHVLFYLFAFCASNFINLIGKKLPKLIEVTHKQYTNGHCDG